MRSSLILLAVLATVPVLATAQNTRPLDVAKATTGQASTAAQPEDRQVCRVEKELGSNRAKRVCRSSAQMERDRERAREELSKATSQIN